MSQFFCMRNVPALEKERAEGWWKQTNFLPYWRLLSFRCFIKDCCYIKNFTRITYCTTIKCCFIWSQTPVPLLGTVNPFCVSHVPVLLLSNKDQHSFSVEEILPFAKTPKGCSATLTAVLKVFPESLKTLSTQTKKKNIPGLPRTKKIFTLCSRFNCISRSI